MFVSACEYAFDIEPYGSRDFIIQARYAENYLDLPDTDFHFQRYLIDLPPGIFDVQYCYTINDDFYDGDTHTRVSDLIDFASRRNARAWTGEVVSNRLVTTRPKPSGNNPLDRSGGSAAS